MKISFLFILMNLHFNRMTIQSRSNLLQRSPLLKQTSLYLVRIHNPLLNHFSLYPIRIHNNSHSLLLKQTSLYLIRIHNNSHTLLLLYLSFLHHHPSHSLYSHSQYQQLCHLLNQKKSKSYARSFSLFKSSSIVRLNISSIVPEHTHNSVK